MLQAGEVSERMRPRTFMCREALWHAFEQFSREQGISVDDLLDEAMRDYANHRAASAARLAAAASVPPPRESEPHDYAADDDDGLARTAARAHLQPPIDAATQEAPRFRAPPPPAGAPRGGPPMSSPMQRPPPSMRGPGSGPGRPFPQPPGHGLPPPPPSRAGARMAPPPPSSRSGAPSRRSLPPPLPSTPSYEAPAVSSGVLALTYQGRHVDVDKDRFILGRSKSNADLVLDDPNVSRQHAAIERAPDGWYIIDLGSTNGVYVNGVRITRHPITDGDTIEITTHQVRCMLR